MHSVRKHSQPVRTSEFLSLLRRPLTGCEFLEARQLLSIDWVAGVCTSPVHLSANVETSAAVMVDKVIDKESALPKATHHYWVGDERVDMHVHPTRVALAVADGVEPLDALPRNGFEFVRGINNDFSVYETVANAVALTDNLMLNGIVSKALPVFVLQSTNSEAVLIDELIVSLQPGIDPEQYFDSNPAYTTYRRLDGTPNQFVATVGGMGEAALEVLNAERDALDPFMAQWMEPNFYQNWQRHYIPNDPRFGNQWHLHNVGQFGATPGADANLPEAWDINQGGSPDLVIGIIDDGVEAHPDLRLWTNPGEIPGNGIDDDGNGWVDDVLGWNFVNNNNQAGPTTSVDSHGTAVAGVAAAIGDNGIGVAGASYNSMVSSARIFEGEGIGSVASDANIASALYYMGGRTADGLGTWKSADIVNNSWGGGGSSTAINSALAWGTTAGRQGVGAAYFFASGNGFSSTLSNPAAQAAVTPGVIAVGSTNSSGVRSDYSNFGTALDFLAPSDNDAAGFLTIDTTDRVGANGYNTGLDPNDDPDLNYTGFGPTGGNNVIGFGGTSSSSPLAAGIGALVLAQADELGVVITAAELNAYLQTTTDLIGNVSYNVSTGKHLQYGFGRINAFTAVAGVGKAEISVLDATQELMSGTSIIEFGATYVGTGTDRTLRIRNQGTSTLELSDVTVTSGPFAIVSVSDSSLAIGESATVVLRYLPTTSGEDSATVAIVSNDSDEGTFTIDVLGIALVRSVSGRVFEDWDGDGTFDEQDLPLSGHVVYIDENGNGQFDNDLFTASFAMTTPRPLPDVTTTRSTIDVVDLNFPVTDVNVTLNITHTWNADLDIALISPSGRRVVLFEGVGGSSDNFINTTLDDQATISITEGSAPFTGSFRPFGLLSDFNGDEPNGTWTLEVTDVAAGDIGTLNSWSIELTGGELSTLTDSEGVYFFEGLAPGTYNLKTAPPSGWVATGVNLNTVTISDPDDFFIDQDFGSVRGDRFYAIVFDDVNGDGVHSESEDFLVNRELFVDANGNGERDVFSNVFNASPGSAITDFTLTTATIDVSGLTNPIIDVNVRVNITHTFNGDLEVFLVHPDGTRVTLFRNIGGPSDNFQDTILDDQAEVSITAGTGPFAGSFRPQGLLSVLNAKAANGEWRLEVFDEFVGDVGVLNSWGLIIETGELSASTDSVGKAFFDLLPGSYDVHLVGTEGWSHTIPVDGIRSVTASGMPMTNQTYGSTMAPTDVVPPTVLAPVIAGSTWQAGFVNAIGSNGLGMQLVPGMQTIVFNDVDRLHLMFSESISNPLDENFELRDSNGLVPFSLSYDATTFVATLAMDSPLAAGKYRLAASDAITDIAGNFLDGDGSGTAGGVFDIRFDVLPGDGDGNQRVNGSDLSVFSRAFNGQIGQSAYNPRADWNADGRVNGSDLAVFAAFFNVNIIGLDEPESPFGGFGRNSRFGPVPHDDFFKGFGEEEEEDDPLFLL